MKGGDIVKQGEIWITMPDRNGNRIKLLVVRHIEGNGYMGAQIHEHRTLTRREDVLVSPGMFAEMWNTYTIHRCFMDCKIGEAPESVWRRFDDAEQQRLDQFQEILMGRLKKQKFKPTSAKERRFIFREIGRGSGLGMASAFTLVDEMEAES